MSPTTQYVLVFDVGGSHISAALCAEHTFALHGLSRAPLPAEGPSSISSHSFGRLIHTLGESAAASAGIDPSRIVGAGLAMPGPFDYANAISLMRHKLQSLYGVDLKAALAARFHWEPAQVRFVNDAAAFLLGEVGAGAAKSSPRSVGITLGTGIGCAYAADGHIAVPSDQPKGIAGVPPGGEIWNLPYNGATVEDFVSTRYLRKQFLTLTGLEAEVSQVAAIALCQEAQPCPELDATYAKQPNGNGRAVQAQDAAKPPSGARVAFEEFGMHLGCALNEHAAAFHPDVIVLGGGIARASNLFLPATRKVLSFPTQIAISHLMDEAPLAGAGVHWFTA